jgi:hypothetical protein
MDRNVRPEASGIRPFAQPILTADQIISHGGPIHDAPDDVQGSIANQSTTFLYGMAGNDTSRTKILVRDAVVGNIDASNPYLRTDIERHFDDPRNAARAVAVARYSQLDRGFFGRTERKLRQLFSPAVHHAIKDGIVKK